MSAGRWHYRRSLASRVALLATIAVGLSLAFVALGAYATVRMQQQRSLDESLQRRAEKVAEGGTLSAITGTRFEVPSWALGAADVRIIFIDSLGQSRSADKGPTLPLGAAELAVAKGESPRVIRTVVADGVHFRVVTVPAGDGQALVLAQSLEPQLRVLRQLGLVMTLFGVAGMYFLMAAPFMALMQILIYVGAVSVLIFFAIMLTRAPGGAAGEEDREPRSALRTVLALLSGVLPAAILAGVILTRHSQELPLKPELPLGRLGEFLSGPYVLAFELISVVLLAAMAGAVVLGFERRKGA